jgi:hypothetical protein
MGRRNAQAAYDGPSPRLSSLADASSAHTYTDLVRSTSPGRKPHYRLGVWRLRPTTHTRYPDSALSGQKAAQPGYVRGAQALPLSLAARPTPSPTPLSQHPCSTLLRRAFPQVPLF